jgi:TonB family protein
MIYGNWQQKQGVEGSNIIKFTIGRDGSISNVVIEQGANEFLNRASQRAVALTQRLPPLPAQYTNKDLTVHLVFQYKR